MHMIYRKWRAFWSTENKAQSYRKTRRICFIMISTLLMVSCENSKKDEESSGVNNSDRESPDVSIKLTAGEAIEKVQLYIAQQQDGKITVQVPYQTSETVKIRCNQNDVDTDPNKNDEFLAKCKPIGGASGAPYGYKSEKQLKTECCKQETIFLSSISPKWTAQYSKPNDSWGVELEFEIENAKKIVSWIVHDKTGVVSKKNND